MKRIALIADIVSSKSILENRTSVQQKLNKVLSGINKTDKSILSPMTITLGDEFQGLFSNFDPLFNIIFKILFTLDPVKIRFSIGIGELNTPINKKSSLGMDGPAFYNARLGIDKLKSNKKLFTIVSTTSDYELLNNTLSLISDIVYPWKKNRLQIIHLLFEGYSITKISKKLKLSEQSIYKNISSGSVQTIINILNEIKETINKDLK